jgi:hypothetical protein
MKDLSNNKYIVQGTVGGTIFHFLIKLSSIDNNY